MFGNHYYHEKIKKCVAVFGRIFNDIYVVRRTSSGTSVSSVKVPLSYGPKRAYLDRIRENPDLDTDTKVAIKLPRMSFEITSFTYDPSRQLQKTNNFQQLGSVINQRNKFFSFVPYRISFELSVYAKSQDDALQIVEQILPYFNPQYTLTIKPFENYPNIREDIPIAITGVSFTDDYEGALTERRTIIYTLNFDMNVNFYGPVDQSDVINTSIANVYNIEAGLNDSDIQLQTITTTPNPDTVYGSPDSDFGFSTTIDLTFDD